MVSPSSYYIACLQALWWFRGERGDSRPQTLVPKVEMLSTCLTAELSLTGYFSFFFYFHRIQRSLEHIAQQLLLMQNLTWQYYYNRRTIHIHAFVGSLEEGTHTVHCITGHAPFMLHSHYYLPELARIKSYLQSTSTEKYLEKHNKKTAAPFYF